MNEQLLLNERRITHIETLVEEIHNELIGENAQPGLRQRVKSLEVARERVLGAIKFVKGASVLTPIIAGLITWFLRK